VLPQFHSFGLTVLTVLPLVLGAKVIYSARFQPRKIVELMREHQPDIFVGIPSMYGALLSVKSAGPEDFASLSVAIAGGEPLPDAVFEQFYERFGVRILEGYGLTETSPITHWSTQERNRRHSVGRPVPRLRQFVVDEHDRVLGVNEEGEILLSGPNVMQGYYNLPAETDQALAWLTPPGESQAVRCLRTGDMGRIDEEGFLYITGRKKEMLIIGGENVFPREIEEVLNHHSAVHASAVIGQHDSMRGEVPVAFIEAEEGQTANEAELRSYCREHLAGYKVPRRIHVVEALPRGATGKILRRKLRDSANEAGAE
jgi:long-chain acyl-CoA synthetase